MSTALSKEIKVQVICCVFNQVEFIKDALNGFVKQKTNFPFEVLVGDDCSTDGTSDIIAEYAMKYPNIIKHIKRNKNLGAQANSFDLLTRVNADYLALCEGDDYWIDENKLQNQVDFLEKNKHLNGVFCKTQILKEPEVMHWNSDFYFPKDEKGNQYWPSNLKKSIVQMKDVLPGIIATSSILYRYNKKFKYPEWFKTVIAGDRPMHCFMIKDGSFGYLDKVMSVYRVSSKGVWFKKNDDKNLVKEVNDWVKMLDNLHNFYGGTFKCIEDYRRNYILNAIHKSYINRNVNNLVALIKTYTDEFFDYIKQLNINQQKKYTFMGIPIWTVKQKEHKTVHYLLGFIPMIKVYFNKDEK